MKQITAVLIGAGLRGVAYSDYALHHPDELKIVGVAEPNKERRERIREKHNLPEEMCVESWEMLLKDKKYADAALICTMDRLHYGPAMQALELGYQLLLEKPISPVEQECLDIAAKAKEKNATVLVCHVLRYTPFYKTLKKLLDEGKIGEIVSVTHNENVGNIHQSHSFVRGNWSNSKKSSPMILQKCCHDMDILQWLIGGEVKSIVSFGDLKYFRKENMPEGAPAYCLDGCPHRNECPYYAPHVYLDTVTGDLLHDAVCADNSPEALTEALRTSPYGRCVFQCDNDVVDHQVANIVFKNGVTVAFTMCAFTDRTNRTMKFMGTKGELRAKMDDPDIIEIRDFITGTVEEYHPSAQGAGHGGGDEGIMRDFVSVLNGLSASTSLSDIQTSLRSHQMCFWAEESRKSGQVIYPEQV